MSGPSTPPGQGTPPHGTPPQGGPPQGSPPTGAPQPWPADPAPAASPAASPAAAAPSAPSAADDPRALEEAVIAALRTCYDPEIPLNIYDLALIYGIEVEANGHVQVRMTLTSPTCPVAGTLPGEVQQKVAAVPGVTAAHVALVWDPPWDPSLLSEAARLQLGLP